MDEVVRRGIEQRVTIAQRGQTTRYPPALAETRTPVYSGTGSPVGCGFVGEVASGPIFQVCWVVADVEAAQQHFTDSFGVPRWLTFPDVHFAPDAVTLRGAPADFTVHVSLGYAGGQQLELIQPVSGSSLYAEFLAEHGPGVQHVAYLVEGRDDLEAALATATAAGAKVPMRGSMSGMDFAYIDGLLPGCHVELMYLSQPMRTLFDQLVPDGFRNPWRH